MRLRESRNKNDPAVSEPLIVRREHAPKIGGVGGDAALGSNRAEAPVVGPRIYNLFPRLIGSIDRWHAHLPRIAAMNFNWVYVNSFHEPGVSGSLYAVKDPFRLNPLFRSGESDDDGSLKAFTIAA